MEENINIQSVNMPIIALRGMVLFPNTVSHFEVGRKKSISAINSAVNEGSDIFLVPQKSFVLDDPKISDLSEVGVVAKVRQVLKMGGESIRVVVEGKYRGFVSNLTKTKPFMRGEVVRFGAVPVTATELQEAALVRRAKTLFEEYTMVSAKISPDIVMNVMQEKRAGALADFIASNIMLEFESKLEILCCLDPIARLVRLCEILSRETQLLNLEMDIDEKVQHRMDDNQRDYYLREQLKVIKDELGESDFDEDADSYKKKLVALKLDESIEEKLLKEADKLVHMPDSSHEAMVIRNYLDVILSLPWNKSTKDKTDIGRARKILDRDHYGLDKVKERILEMLAVRILTGKNSGKILCLVGAPGVGKTSIAKSVANAIGKKYERISLGGVSDEAEIRGHRRTYIGSMPGRIMNAVISAKSNNALILLDEVDKLGSDYKGDPSSALLEALDPEQNSTFCDHYIDVPFDLSNILFMTTANDLSTIPGPLRDRMEIIEITSYTQEEKFHICKEHLIPKQLKKNGLNSKTLKISDGVINAIIDGYTREGGVRSLERQIERICSKTARMIVEGEREKVSVKNSDIEDFLGPVKFKREAIDSMDLVGVVNGLAWTSVGGEMLKIEVAVMDGTGKLELTGSLGNVMQESAKAALSYVRSHCEDFMIDSEFYKNKDIHIHVPEGAVPKDGPSAGVTMTTALVSALSGRAVKHDAAMTGEISLTGRVMAIGGLREKSMAAYSNGIKTVFIPCGNISDLGEVSEEVRRSIDFVPVNNVEEILSCVLVSRMHDFSIPNIPETKLTQRSAIIS